LFAEPEEVFQAPPEDELPGGFAWGQEARDGPPEDDPNGGAAQ